MKNILPEDGIKALLTLFSKQPKGFGKFFDESDAPAPKNVAKDESKPESNEKPPKKKELDDLSKLFFKEKTESSGSGRGGGKSSGNGDDYSKYYSIAMLATVFTVAGFMHYSFKHHEINWKEFIA